MQLTTHIVIHAAYSNTVPHRYCDSPRCCAQHKRAALWKA
jgi:hypothetical protein